MSEVRDFIRKLDEEETILLDPQTNEDREIVKNLRESIADFKTPLGPVPHPSVIDSCIRWIEKARGRQIVKNIENERDVFILRFIEYLNENGIQYDKSAKIIRTKGEPTVQIFPATRGDLIETKFDNVFYDNLAQEINLAYKLGMFTSALILSRKIIENLVIEVFRAKFPRSKTRNVNLFYDKKKRRFHDLSYLIDKLEIKNKKNAFGPDKQAISKFLSQVKPFRTSANSNAHSIIENPKHDDVAHSNIQYMVALLAKAWNDLK
jgi:hypothetical protein